MSQILIAAPASEPLTLADLKNFLRVDDPDDDALVAALALAARQHLEQVTGRAFVTQSWRLVRDQWPRVAALALPMTPVAALTAVRVITKTGPEAVSTSLFRLDGAGAPARLSWTRADAPNPEVAIAGIEIELTAGYGPPSAVPAPLVHAIRLLTAHWYENRQVGVVGHMVNVMPRAIEALIAPYIVRRIG